MSNKCLCCNQEMKPGTKDYHPACSRAFFGTEQPPDIPYTPADLARLGKTVVERSVSVPGVQTKISMSLIREAQQKGGPRLTVVGALGGRYIMKPPTPAYPELPANEHLSMRLADKFGIQTTPHALGRFKSGELVYLTKRIDRNEHGQKIHMLDMFQITEAFDKYRSSLEKVAGAVNMYSNQQGLDAGRFFELCLFCFYIGNNDLHLKNFSMIETQFGWGFAPAYDLLNVQIANPKDTEESALSLQGKRRKLNRSHFEYLGQKAGLNKKQIERFFARLARFHPEAERMIKASFLSPEMQKAYLATVRQRIKTLNP